MEANRTDLVGAPGQSLPTLEDLEFDGDDDFDDFQDFQGPDSAPPVISKAMSEA